GAYLAPEAFSLPPGTPTLERLLSPGSAPARQVVLEPGTAPPVSAPTPFTGHATLVSRDALEVRVDAIASAPSYLVLTDSYAPDWRVGGDGPTPALPGPTQMVPAGGPPHHSHPATFPLPPA